METLTKRFLKYWMNVDKQIPAGTEMLTAEAALEREGYVGIMIPANTLTECRGEKPDESVHVWVKKENLVPDFSSFDNHR